MTEADVIRMADAADVWYAITGDKRKKDIAALTRFAALVRAQALERAIFNCEGERLSDSEENRVHNHAVDDCICAIRGMR